MYSQESHIDSSQHRKHEEEESATPKSPPRSSVPPVKPQLLQCGGLVVVQICFEATQSRTKVLIVYESLV